MRQVKNGKGLVAVRWKGSLFLYWRYTFSYDECMGVIDHTHALIV